MKYRFVVQYAFHVTLELVIKKGQSSVLETVTLGQIWVLPCQEVNKLKNSGNVLRKFIYLALVLTNITTCYGNIVHITVISVIDISNFT